MASNGFLFASLFSGTFFGAFFGPLLLEEYRRYQRERRWKKPRKKLLLAKLKSSPKSHGGWVGIDTLCIVTGTTEDECRTLLIEVGARGGRMKDGKGNFKEGWALLERQPLSGATNETE